MLIYGESNSGKSEFCTRLKQIFQCETYVELIGTPFAADYKQNEDFDHTTYNPSFVIIEEGAYESLFENGNKAGNKEFFEGKGKAL